LFRIVHLGRRASCAAVLFASVMALLPALASAAQRFGGRTLQEGMRGPDVQILQRDLSDLGWTTRPTGRFTRLTLVHVKDCQRTFKLSADGVVGPKTYRKLASAMTVVEDKNNAPDTTTAPTASASSATLPADDSGGAGFVPTNTAATAPVEAAVLNSDGTVTAPADAPEVVQEVIAAANQIAFDPYVFGGGHSGWGAQTGYDCSGSTSFALHAAGLLSGMPLD
jgi:peptidoglycan hydrolase-like protein with peptidoglycan-binding domain